MLSPKKVASANTPISTRSSSPSQPSIHGPPQNLTKINPPWSQVFCTRWLTQTWNLGLLLFHLVLSFMNTYEISLHTATLSSSQPSTSWAREINTDCQAEVDSASHHLIVWGPGSYTQIIWLFIALHHKHLSPIPGLHLPMLRTQRNLWWTESSQITWLIKSRRKS